MSVDLEIDSKVIKMAKAHKLPSGTWRCVANWTDEYGNYKQKSFTASSRQEAEFLASKFLTEKKHSLKPENKTLDDLITSYINNRSSLLSPSTIKSYDKIRRTAFPSIIKTRASLLTPELYQKAINEYSKNHSPKSVFNAHALANKVLKSNDIFITEKTILPQKEKKEVSIPTDEEVSKLLDYTKGSRLYLLIAFSVFLGLRKSETIALKWSDIDFEEHTVSINKARVKDQFDVYVEKATKTTSSTRTLKIPQVLYDTLTEADHSDLDAYIIDDSIDALVSLYNRTKDKIDFPYKFHALRHYYASVLLVQGLPNKYAQKQMGHATDNMLKQVYQHTFKSKEEEYEAALDTYFSSLGSNVKKEEQ